MGSNAAQDDFPYRITVICGARRTGTTLMNQILCSDPGTHAQIGEARLIAKLLELCGWADDNYDNVVQWYFEDRARSDAYFEAMLATLLDNTVAALRPGNRIILKAPNFAPLVKTTLDRLPNSDMLVCVRSPFDQVVSDFEVELRQIEQGMKKQNRSTNRDFAGFSRVYMRQYTPVLAAREQYAERLHFIRYEDVVHDTAATIARIETLFGLDLSAYDPNAEWKNFANKDALAKMPAHVKQYGSPLDSSRTGRFRDVLTDDEIKTVRRICTPMIDAFYPELAVPGEERTG